MLGIGAGWYERESRGLGFPFPSLGERFERLEETLQLAKQMWADDPSPFQGKHYQLAEPITQLRTFVCAVFVPNAPVTG